MTKTMLRRRFVRAYACRAREESFSLVTTKRNGTIDIRDKQIYSFIAGFDSSMSFVPRVRTERPYYLGDLWFSGETRPRLRADRQAKDGIVGASLSSSSPPLLAIRSRGSDQNQI